MSRCRAGVQGAHPLGAALSSRAAARKFQKRGCPVYSDFISTALIHEPQTCDADATSDSHNQRCPHPPPPPAMPGPAFAFTLHNAPSDGGGHPPGRMLSFGAPRPPRPPAIRPKIPSAILFIQEPSYSHAWLLGLGPLALHLHRWSVSRILAAAAMVWFGSLQVAEDKMDC